MMSKIFHKIYLGDYFVNIPGKRYLIDIVDRQLTKDRISPKIIFYLNSATYYHDSENNAIQKPSPSADYCYLNSFYIGWLIKKLYGISLQKLNAEDFIYEIFDLCEKRKKKIFLLGSDKNTLKNTIQNIHKGFPALYISGYHGYFITDQPVLNKILGFKPDLLIVGLGSGKQENWIHVNKTNLKKIKVIITVGNFIDILGGSRQLPPKWMKKYKIEWCYRLIKEPKRLWKRYIFGGIITTHIFLKNLLIKVKCQVKK